MDEYSRITKLPQPGQARKEMEERFTEKILKMADLPTLEQIRDFQALIEYKARKKMNQKNEWSLKGYAYNHFQVISEDQVIVYFTRIDDDYVEREEERKILVWKGEIYE